MSIKINRAVAVLVIGLSAVLSVPSAHAGDYVIDGNLVVNSNTTLEHLSVTKNIIIGSGSAKGEGALVQGVSSLASGAYTRAEGYYCSAVGAYNHAEGLGSKARGYASHAEDNAIWQRDPSFFIISILLNEFDIFCYQRF
ncbi:MAG: hypothetical protein PHP44_14825 [Kiritimatiellae bacterium]|nr:hypothetical protein [Kiritimatiellia bacterium]